MNIPTHLAAACALVALSGCAGLTLSGIQDMSASEDLRPPNAEPGACYGREISPATIETVTQHMIVQAASYKDDGSLETPAKYQTETRQQIVVPRRDIWFKTPCRKDVDTSFIPSVQRALAARGLFHGRITGLFDAKTRRAIRRYQNPLGLDSGTLSLASARKLGLVAIEFPDTQTAQSVKP